MKIEPKVTIYLQTADKTRKAQVTLPRTTSAADLIKASRRQWILSFGAEFQVVNMNTQRQLAQHDLLTSDLVSNGDTLMLQPLPTHGGA
jgi:ubiquitin-protein ligase